jgi:putative ABC transport system permease protein
MLSELLLFPSLAANAFHTLRGNLQRTLLSTLGVAIGTATLIFFVTLGDSLERYLADRVLVAGVTTLQIVPGRSAAGDPDVQARRARPIPEAELQALRSLHGVDAVGLLVQRMVDLHIAGHNAPIRVHASGASADSPALYALDIVEGRAFAHMEIARKSRVVLVSDGLVDEVSKSRVALSDGSRLRMADQEFRVIGIFRTEPGDPPSVYIPLGALPQHRQTLSEGRAVVQVRAQHAQDISSIHASLQDWVAGLERRGFGQFRIVHPEQLIREVTTGLRVLQAAFAAVAAMALLVGGIGIMNVMLASVAERTREIGIRRSVGAAKHHVVTQLLLESVVVTGLGAIAGSIGGFVVALGASIAMFHSTSQWIPPIFSTNSIVVAVAITCGIGLVFGLHPALRAGRMTPVDCLRHE